MTTLGHKPMKRPKPHPIIWLAFGMLLLLVFILGAIFVARSLDLQTHQSLMASLPLGSSISRLDSVAKSPKVWGGRVTQWRPLRDAGADETPPQSRITTEFGVYQKVSIGEYSAWHPAIVDREQFSGVITLYVDRSFADSVVLEFTYVNGQLVGKDWGYMPG